MADLFSLLGVATRSLEAQRFGLAVAGQNIANVNTPGYARRSAQFAEVRPTDGTSSGGGVDVVGVTAARAPLLEARLRFEEPAAAREGAVASQLAVVEAALGRPGASVDGALARFYNQYAALSRNPTSGAEREQVIVEARSLAKTVAETASQLATAQRSADTQIRETVGDVNTLASQLADLNAAIYASGSDASQGLFDQQAVALHALNALVDVGVIPRGDGTVDVTVGNGRALVVGVDHYDLSVESQPPDGFAAIESDGAAVRTDVTTEISGGRISGLLRVRDELLPGYASQLDQLAYSVATDVNTLARSGFDLAGTAGVDFFVQPSVVAGAARSMAVSRAVAADSDLVVAAGAAVPGNNDIARAIAALQDTVMTGSTTRPVEAWGTLVYSVAADAKAAGLGRDSHEQIVQQLQSLRDEVSGVSLDEEAAMLLRFQRSYEANAKFFQVVDQTLDTLMRLVRL